ncbi:unnamed protein product [Urochloa decumbens]|uniref:DUF1618 domain-containing protein n=1 Tax=Urochloa decumbens TaxID=240449 RepID=A0ABC9CQL2_9POAL
MSAAGFPHWVLLEPFVFRRDDDESFPDESSAPIRASATTSWGAVFRIAFDLADPPLISRLYAHLPEPGFLGPDKATPLAILATHRHLALLRVATETPVLGTVQDFYIYNAENPSSLELLPPCTEPDIDYARGDRRIPRRGTTPAKEGAPARQRMLAVRSMGLLCRGGGEFAVAELKLFKLSNTVHADICCFKSAAGLGKWDSNRVPILHSDNPDDFRQLTLWQTDAVIPSDRWLCWIDYYRGILFCDLFGGPTPTVSFIRFPLEEFPSTHNRSIASSWLYRGVSVIDAGSVLKFVDVARDDDIGYGALEPGASFTITCHTLPLGSMALKNRLGSTVWNKDAVGRMLWNKDSTVTSTQLWSTYPSDGLPRGIPMFPQVNIARPHLVHFLLIEFGCALKKMWLVTINMNTKTVESFSPLIKGMEDRGKVDFDLTQERSICPKRFIPCELSRTEGVCCWKLLAVGSEGYYFLPSVSVFGNSFLSKFSTTTLPSTFACQPSVS